MSILKLSEDLKDVPDHFLVSEVRQPTGSYPGYLVVAELERRKGMRDRYMKEAPKSTVVDDLSQPSREQMMSAVAQMQQPAPQQQPLPPQMPMPPQMPPQIPQMPAAGLMATPQASSLAATDAMASPRKRMAGGGLVAFQEGGDVKRFAGEDGSYVYDPTRRGQSPNYDPTASTPIGDMLQSVTQFEGLIGGKRKKKGDIPVDSSTALLESASGQVPYPKAITELPPAKDRLAAAEQGILEQKAAQINAEKMGPPRFDSAAPRVAQADIPLPPPYSLPASRGGAGTDYMKIFQGIKAPSAPTAAEEAAIAKSGEERYATAVPNRLESVEKELGSRTQNLKDRRKSALNEALMMAGIGVLKSKSPGRYFGEGAEEGMLAYRQSMKDVRGGEDLMTQARQDLAKAQILQDQGKFEAGQKMLDRGIQKEQIANQKFQTESQNLSYGANANIHSRANEIAAEQLALQKALGPAQYYSLIAGGQRSLTAADLNDARAAAQGVGAPQVLVAQLKANIGNPTLIKLAQSKLMQSGISTADPTYDQQLAAVYQQLAGIPGASTVAPPPMNRNQQVQPLGG
jgi:hypothetical protein